MRRSPANIAAIRTPRPCHPSRAGAKNRLYSEIDIRRVQRIQRLTQEMGVNLAGVELILRLLDEMEDVRKDMERLLDEYVADAEKRISQLIESPMTPIRRDERLLPVPNIRLKKVEL